MSVAITFSLNERLYVKDPQQSVLGKKIIEHSILLINEIGFESFTFKKLAQRINSTEASVYRYFENKHLLLTYLVAWYWEWVSYLIAVNMRNITDPKVKLGIIINSIIFATKENPAVPFVNESVLHDVVISESTKVFYTKDIDKENSLGFFKSYKKLVIDIAAVVQEIDNSFAYPNAFASNLFEMSSSHIYFAKHLPRLTDINSEQDIYEEVEKMMLYFAKKLLY